MEQIDGGPVDRNFAELDEFALEPGVILLWSNFTLPPDGWVYCDGMEYRREEQPRLFNRLGTTYGSSGPDVFAVPNLTGIAATIQYIVRL